MSDYHSLLWNLVILVRYMQMRAQEVCECQDAKFNWSIHTTEFWLQHLRRLYFQQKLKIIVVANKSQLTLKQWLHRVVNEMINCFVWRDAQRDHIITFDTIAYISQINEQTFRKTRHIIDIFFRDDTLRITIEQLIIAIQYNFHMSHVNRANQLRCCVISSDWFL